MKGLHGLPVAVIDTETTGVGDDARVVQIAVVVIDQFGITQPRLAFSSLVNPGCAIPQAASDIHHITDELVKGAPTWKDVDEEVWEICLFREIAAYNLPFDARMITAERERVGGPPIIGGLDPLVWAKLTDKYERSKKLVDVANRRGLSFDAHDAAADAMTTAQLMPILLEELRAGRRGQRGWLGPWLNGEDADVDDFLAWQTARALEQEQDFADWCMRNDRPAPRPDWHLLTNTPITERTS